MSNIIHTNNFHFVNDYFIYIYNVDQDYKYYFHFINGNYYFYIKNKKKRKENFKFTIIKKEKTFDYIIKNEKENIIKLNNFKDLQFKNKHFYKEDEILKKVENQYYNLNLENYKENLFGNDYIDDNEKFNIFLKLNWYFFGKNNRFQYFKYIINKLKDKIMNINYTKISYDENKKYNLIFIDDRFDSIFKYILILFLYSINNEWNLTIYTTQKNKEKYLEVLDDLNVKGKINIINNISNKKDYSNLLKNNYFWKDMNEEYCLLFQYDSLAFKKFDNKFFSFNYLGARWPEHITQVKNIYNGNGGTSLRNINIMKFITSKYDYNLHGFNKNGDDLPEDVYFAKYMDIENLNKVDFDILDEFSFECIYNEKSTYGHAIYESIDLNNLEEYITNRINKIL